ncbi:hypothetical protein HDG35_007021 [Paraburkholderia sp. JPY681]|uniref:Uncharacterized protein n=1 Tax=Paraburkholderia atlantica TaxID=2654982 RepID=D5WKG5_PARAM|nr:hypothetical protein BC1002_5821 [Paraburkholderia atlantica]MBB5510724.1 hypothetical protein [Paraburkholderia atlantica]
MNQASFEWRNMCPVPFAASIAIDGYGCGPYPIAFAGVFPGLFFPKGRASGLATGLAQFFGSP